MHQDDECNKKDNIPPKIRKMMLSGVSAPALICFFYALSFLYSLFSFKQTGFPWTPVIAISIWGLLALGVYKGLRSCAIAALLLFVVDQLSVELIPPGRHFSVLWICFTYIAMICFTSGIVSTFRFHQYNKKGVNNSEGIYKNVIIITLILFVAFHACYWGAMKYVQAYNQKALWNDFYEKTLMEREKAQLPIKVTDNILFSDYYFENHALIVEHQVKSGTLSELPIKELYSYSRSSYRRYCSSGLATSIDLKMIFRFEKGYETRDLTFTPRDCQF